MFQRSALQYSMPGSAIRIKRFNGWNGSFRSTGEINYLKVDPVMDNLLSDPQFGDLMRRVGL